MAKNMFIEAKMYMLKKIIYKLYVGKELSTGDMYNIAQIIEEFKSKEN